MARRASPGARLGFEETLWQAANKLCGNLDPAEYKNVVLGLIFLRYISDAFNERYDALGANESAIQELGDKTLRLIARELVRLVRANVSIDWTVRESARARLRILVKRVLRQYGYPPDKQEAATATVLQQAELFSGAWSA